MAIRRWGIFCFRGCKMKKLIFVIFAIAAVMPLTAATPQRRFGGGSLSRSVQNETLAAIDRATDWLVSRQNDDGSFGTNDVRLTSLCSLALFGGSAEIPPAHRRAVDKAVAWLEANQSEASAETNLSSLAWRSIALTVLSTNSAVKEGIVLPPAVAGDYSISDAAYKVWPLCEARLLRGMEVSEPAVNSGVAFLRLVSEAERTRPDRERLAGLTAAAAREFVEGKYSSILSDPAVAWWLARTVNRECGGELFFERDGEVVSVAWRRNLAGKWVSSQKSDEYGRGFWDNSLERTAFALLLLSEL